jgi:phosphoglycolate phosphatase
MSTIQLVMFDFDGTLVDTAGDLIRSTNRFLESKGQQRLPEETIRAHIGFGLKNLMLDSFPEALENPEQISQIEKEFLAIYDEEFLKTPELFPNAREFLQTWKGKLAIVSNKRERYIHPILKHLGLDTLPWSAVIGGDTFPQMKPDPKPFRAAMQSAGTDHASTVMVGDGEPDVEGALRAGVHSIAVSFGYSSIERLVHLGAKHTIRDFSELTGKLKQFDM